MPNQADIALMAHLMRRAGFGASRAELEERCARGYEATVEELLNPGADSGIDEDELYRYFPQFESSLAPVAAQTEWVYRMVNTRWPLKEKMALFWHQLFATGNSKVDNPPEMLAQVAMFRKEGLTNFPNLLVQLAQNPAMIYWLDNNGNHYGSINENWGRELLELFSMGVGHYSEDDIKEASRAFTGWTIGTKPPRQPVGRFYWSFEFRPEDHDYGEKEFLGNTGNFDGGDIIDIIVKQEDTARFLARHLYNFFVADEPQVPAWNITPPNDEAAIDLLVKAYMDSDADIKSILRALFNSDFFKEAQFPAREESRRAGRQHSPAGRKLHPAANGVPPAGLRVRLAGSGTDESPQRGKLAHRFRVDRRWSPGTEGQLRGQAAFGYVAARGQGHNGWPEGTGNAESRRICSLLPGPGWSG